MTVEGVSHICGSMQDFFFFLGGCIVEVSILTNLFLCFAKRLTFVIEKGSVISEMFKKKRYRYERLKSSALCHSVLVIIMMKRSSFSTR